MVQCSIHDKDSSRNLVESIGDDLAYLPNEERYFGWSRGCGVSVNVELVAVVVSLTVVDVLSLDGDSTLDCAVDDDPEYVGACGSCRRVVVWVVGPKGIDIPRFGL